MNLIAEENCLYTAWTDDAGDYFLEAVCGTVAVFTITVKLNAEEIAAYQRDPSSLRTLAFSISDAPDDFLGRRV